MNQALFLNGVYKNVLEEIITAQSNKKDLVCFLQPYRGTIIKLLERNDFTKNPSIPLYLSTTTALGSVGYIAKIVGWENKTALRSDEEKLNKINKQIKKYQPSEKNVYFFSETDKTKKRINLIEIKNLKKLDILFYVTNLIKVSDNKPCRPRTRAGGWSPVYEVSTELLQAKASFLAETLEKKLNLCVEKSLSDSSDERKKRLQKAIKKPTVIQIVSKGFRRNPDVIAEVLERANGVCESCKLSAPFIRKKDNTPYLEVHHKLTLAEGGEDIVKNTEALCPNCHREAHFGV